MASVVIPAYNEETLIERTLNNLADIGRSGTLEVVVVCNGCSDRTAAVARRCAPWARVEEIAEASKTAALNRGDEVAAAWPRIYLDADIDLTADDLIRLVLSLEETGALVAAPAVELKLSDSPWLVRAYYRVWHELAVHPGTIAGPGVFCVTERGRLRFDVFPNLVADDQFVQTQFEVGERVTVDDAVANHDAPKTVAGLVARLIRVHAGNKELAEKGLARSSMPRTTSRAVLGVVRRRPSLTPDVAAYLVLAAYTHGRARRRVKAGHGHQWTRDESSRA